MSGCRLCVKSSNVKSLESEIPQKAASPDANRKAIAALGANDEFERVLSSIIKLNEAFKIRLLWLVSVAKLPNIACQTDDPH